MDGLLFLFNVDAGKSGLNKLYSLSAGWINTKYLHLSSYIIIHLLIVET